MNTHQHHLTKVAPGQRKAARRGGRSLATTDEGGRSWRALGPAWCPSTPDMYRNPRTNKRGRAWHSAGREDWGGAESIGSTSHEDKCATRCTSTTGVLRSACVCAEVHRPGLVAARRAGHGARPRSGPEAPLRPTVNRVSFFFVSVSLLEWYWGEGNSPVCPG
jgi:hypothetical protein